MWKAELRTVDKDIGYANRVYGKMLQLLLQWCYFFLKGYNIPRLVPICSIKATLQFRQACAFFFHEQLSIVKNQIAFYLFSVLMKFQEEHRRRPTDSEDDYISLQKLRNSELEGVTLPESSFPENILTWVRLPSQCTITMITLPHLLQFMSRAEPISPSPLTWQSKVGVYFSSVLVSFQEKQAGGWRFFLSPSDFANWSIEIAKHLLGRID